MATKGPPPPDGGSGKIADKREHFERLSRESRRDPEAERAFVESKLRMVESDPTMSAEEKKAALEELRRKFKPRP
jgi:hypothetical protein